MRKDREDGDRLRLLPTSSSATPLSRETYRFREPQPSYELHDVEGSDIGIQNPTMRYLDPPPYPFVWDSFPEHTRKGATSFNDFSREVSGRSSTFEDFSGEAEPPVKKRFERFLRFLLRSGRYASHISYEQASLDPSKKPKKFSGWRGGVLMAATSAGSVLLINFLFTIYSGVKSGSGLQVGTVYHGDCDTVRKADSWLHIAINVMGTLLLGASNYTMQCIAAPTRGEIDASHSSGKHMDIGLPSIRNLHGWKKKTLFGLLVVSTLPLHFLWNSAVFITTQRLDYNVYVVTPKFLTNSTVDCSQNVTQGWNSFVGAATDYNTHSRLDNLEWSDYINTTTSERTAWWADDICNTSQILRSSYSNNNLTRLDSATCINAYGPGNGFMSGYANLLAVTKEQPAGLNNSVLLAFKYEGFVSNYTGNRWVCNSEHLINSGYNCNYKDIAKNAGNWSLGPIQSAANNDYSIGTGDKYAIDYCLAEPTTLAGKCELQYSLVIMLCVLAANCIKFGCIVFTLVTNLDQVLATVGDAIASFIETPDPITAGRPFLSREQALSFKIAEGGRAQPYHPVKLRWWRAPSWKRWFITLILCIVAIGTVASLLDIGNTSLLANASGLYSSPYEVKFGAYSEYATINIFNFGSSPTAEMFDSNRMLIAMVTLANLPQVIVSCLYFAINTVFTSMVSADEWARFITHRKALRTTDPLGQQRSTYWLSLPWTYALPVAVASSILHWLISQSLFVSRTEVLNVEGTPEPLSYMNVGYNPLAILLSLFFGIGLLLALIATGFRRLAYGSALVGNNSLAIAAACHRTKDDFGAEKKKVQWGAVRHEDEEGNPGHCCFSSEAVELPKWGDKYL